MNKTNLVSLLRPHRKNCQLGVTRPPVFGGPLVFFAHAHTEKYNVFCCSVRIRVRGSTCFERWQDLRVSGNCRLCEVSQEVGLGDQVDDVHSVRTVVRS